MDSRADQRGLRQVRLLVRRTPTARAPRLYRAEDPTALGRGRYTACAHSVALNETDLCIANLWLTSQRLLIHP